MNRVTFRLNRPLQLIGLVLIAVLSIESEGAGDDRGVGIACTID